MNRTIVGLVLALCLVGCDASSSSTDSTTTTVDERCAKLARSVPAILRAIGERVNSATDELDSAESDVNDARDRFQQGNFAQGMSGLDDAEAAIGDARSSLEGIPATLEEAASKAEEMNC
jgi:septation ring formation regulator EzrA